MSLLPLLKKKAAENLLLNTPVLCLQVKNAHYFLREEIHSFISLIRAFPADQ